MKFWNNFFIKKKIVKTVDANIIGRAFAEFTITAIRNWWLFSFNDELPQRVKEEEQYLFAFAIEYIIEEVLKDTPECSIALKAYNSGLEKKINDFCINNTFVENLTKSRAIAYREALKNPKTKYWFVDLGKSFSIFCENIEKPELIAEGIFFFTICANIFRKSLANVKFDI